MNGRSLDDHGENNVIKVDEFVILKDFLETSKYTFLYLRNDHPCGFEVLNMNEAIIFK